MDFTSCMMQGPFLMKTMELGTMEWWKFTIIFQWFFYIQILTTYLYFAENHDTNRINEVFIKMISKNIMMTIFDCYRERDSSIVLRQRNWDEWRQRQRWCHIRQDFPGGWELTKTMLLQKKAELRDKIKYFDFTSKLFNWEKQFILKNDTHYLKIMYMSILDIPTEKTVMVVINNVRRPKLSKQLVFRKT
jgi:hypothetical protein